MLLHAPSVGLANVAFLLHYVWYTSGDEYIPLECFRHVLGLSCTFMSLPLWNLLVQLNASDMF